MSVVPRTTPSTVPDTRGGGRANTYVCTIPAVPPSFNVYNRLHWAEQAKRRDEWHRMLLALLNEKGNKCQRGLERVELRAVIQFTTVRRRDSDNFSMPLWKWTQDALVGLNIIPDDDHERCRALPPAIVVGDTEQTVLIVMGEGGGED